MRKALIFTVAAYGLVVLLAGACARLCQPAHTAAPRGGPRAVRGGRAHTHAAPHASSPPSPSSHPTPPACSDASVRGR